MCGGCWRSWKDLGAWQELGREYLEQVQEASGAFSMLNKTRTFRQRRYFNRQIQLLRHLVTAAGFVFAAALPSGANLWKETSEEHLCNTF